MLRQKAVYYYLDQNKSCSEAILMAACEECGLNISDAEASLFTGFRAGMGCGSTCGALTGAIGALSRIFRGREDLAAICAEYVGFFRCRMGLDSLECSVLSGVYKNPERRCAAAVELAADTLEEFLQKSRHSPVRL